MGVLSQHPALTSTLKGALNAQGELGLCKHVLKHLVIGRKLHGVMRGQKQRHVMLNMNVSCVSVCAEQYVYMLYQRQ